MNTDKHGSEIEQLRKENQRLQQDRDAAIRQLADEGRTRGAVELERDRLRDENQQLRSELEAANKWKEAVQEATALNWVLTAEVEQLRAIVAKLPKTADGVPIGLEMIAWSWSEDSGSVEEVVVRQIDGGSAGVQIMSTGSAVYWFQDCSRLYATREAAIAASKGEVQHG